MKSFFDKTEYTLDDIQSLIDNKIEEGSYLEFKDADSLAKDEKRKIEISKDVSAFANSNGGVLIYGLREKDRTASEIRWIDATKFSKDWLLQVIEQNVGRRITKIEALQVINPTNNNEQIYILKIWPSDYMPHMAANNVYYMRDSKGNVAMEEYLVRELYNRKGKSDLVIGKIYGMDGLACHPHMGKPTEIKFQLNFFIQNIGVGLEHHYKLEIKLPSGFGTLESFNYYKNYTIRDNDNSTYFTFTNINPLFQEEIDQSTGVTITVRKEWTDRFLSSILELKLYYSNGTKSYTYPFREHLRFGGSEVKATDFF